jgi:hypothetical protein
MSTRLIKHLEFLEPGILGVIFKTRVLLAGGRNAIATSPTPF